MNECEIVAIETMERCTHGAEKGDCLIVGCHFGDECRDCEVCGGIHTLAFWKSGIDCRAAYPVRSKQ
jgi:hypothetical protein